jgi:hypothetical protein
MHVQSSVHVSGRNISKMWKEFHRDVALPVDMLLVMAFDC